MRKILNPYVKIEGYNCFGCSPDNEHGLQLQFYEDGDYLITEWEPRGFLQGYHNILHGGIQATLIDEIGNWLVMIKLKTASVTSELTVRYLKPVHITKKGKIKLRASLKKVDKNNATVYVERFDGEGIKCAEGEPVYFVYPVAIAKKRLFFPDYEDFFEKDASSESSNR
jgi:uncharacterized protein (TIGR00369 family)